MERNERLATLHVHSEATIQYKDCLCLFIGFPCFILWFLLLFTRCLPYFYTEFTRHFQLLARYQSSVGVSSVEHFPVKQNFSIFHSSNTDANFLHY